MKRKICSKCTIEQPLKNYHVQRSNGKHPYILTYCNLCRYKQNSAVLNNNPEKFLKDRFRRLKIRAKKSNIKFDLTFDYFLEIYKKQNKRCFYTNKKMCMKVMQGSSWDAFTIDKVIPEKGYVKGNIVFCRKRINTSKHLFTLKEMKLYMPLWYNKIITTEWLNI